MAYTEAQRPYGLSILIPTLNEEGNLSALFYRIDTSLRAYDIPYEVIVIDDHSTDATVATASSLAAWYPVRVAMKQGERGKAQSLLEGFHYATFNTVAMIDADLQYSPEALPAMMYAVQEGADVVAANRSIHQEPLFRRLASTLFTFLFVRLLHGLTCDAQAGLKVFRHEVLAGMDLAPSPWAFDLAFLVTAQRRGYAIHSVDIPFARRQAGESKVRLLSVGWQIATQAIALRFTRERVAGETASSTPLSEHDAVAEPVHEPYASVPDPETAPLLALPEDQSAVQTLVPWQRIVLVLLLVLVVTGTILAPLATSIAILAVLSVAYVADMLFNLWLVKHSLTSFSDADIHASLGELAALEPETLPVYSILCPLYREEAVLPGFLAAIDRLEWPKEKLDVLLLLEADDTGMIELTNSMQLPPYIRTIIVPPSFPKTKPKACNEGLARAQGEYIVIYDAEDVPDPLQLKKAYLGFQSVPDTVKCLQARLNYYNPQQNLLTRLFAAEYALWFDVMLPGMQSINTAIPLGGTSNHFRTEDLRQLQGWDPFNVTEDCDLGARLFRQGFRTAIIDSVTLEEANSRIGNWLRQRSRWVKGYLQTYFVHMRHPFRFVRDHGLHALAFQFIVGGKVAFMVINPIMWLATIAYFAANAWVGPAIEAVYPSSVLTLASISLVFGNFLFLYYYMIGCARHGHWHLLKYVFFVPLYWGLTSIAALMAVTQLIVRPHYWEKTRHGLHLPETSPLPEDAAAIRFPAADSSTEGELAT